MNILGIETSCDETAAAIVADGTKIISTIVASSQAMHAKFGGIIPEKAAREQLKAIIPVIAEALGSREKVQELDAVAVTVGPGLIGSLLVGVETAKALSLAWNKPLIPINHLVGHIYANWLTEDTPQLPAIVLLVSGGHSELILMRNHGDFTYVGGTRDDAAGECFDKCARILNLGYPGGPAIEKAADETREPAGSLRLPRPLINEPGFDFSFSGLKTAVSRTKDTEPNFLAWELQEAVTDVLVKKTLTAAREYAVKSVLLAGGVAANKKLREKMAREIEKSGLAVTLHVPPFNLCTDNAAYIAAAAAFNNYPVPPIKIDAIPSLTIDNGLAKVA